MVWKNSPLALFYQKARAHAVLGEEHPHAVARILPTEQAASFSLAPSKQASIHTTRVCSLWWSVFCSTCLSMQVSCREVPCQRCTSSGIKARRRLACLYEVVCLKTWRRFCHQSCPRLTEAALSFNSTRTVSVLQGSAPSSRKGVAQRLHRVNEEALANIYVDYMDMYAFFSLLINFGTGLAALVPISR